MLTINSSSIKFLNISTPECYERQCSRTIIPLAVQAEGDLHPSADSYISSRLSERNIGSQLSDDAIKAIAEKFENIENKYTRKSIELECLEQNGHTKEAARYRLCGQFYRVYRCPTCGKHTFTHSDSCNLRICPDCCKKFYWRMKRRLWRSIEPYGYVRGEYKKFMLREITLTWEEDVQNADHKTLIVNRRNQINRLLSKYRRKGRILGDIKVFETKRSSNDFGRVHIHAHLLTVSSYISQKELSNDWNAITGNPIVWIQLRRADQAIGYLLKHIYKPPELLPHDLPMFLDIFSNRRRITTDGILFASNDLKELKRSLHRYQDMLSSCGAVEERRISRRIAELKLAIKSFTCDMAITQQLLCRYCGTELDEYVKMSAYLIIRAYLRGEIT